MGICAVIGSPIEHSLSPIIHQTAYRIARIDDRFTYTRREVPAGGLSAFLDSLDERWVGLSVTAPHKSDLLAFGEAEPVAVQLRSANTLIFHHDGQPPSLYNTDVSGMVNALARAGMTSARTGLIVGNGATARSSLAAMHALGIERVDVLARDKARAHTSLDPIASLFSISLDVHLLGSQADLPTADLVISTIPARHEPSFAEQIVRRGRMVFELVYNFYPSTLNQVANRLKIPNLDGLDLLVAQAIDQIRLMTGALVEPEPLVEACRAALGFSR